MSSVADVIEPVEQSNAITTIEESNASNHILTNLTDPTEDALKVYDAKVTIRSLLYWIHIFRDRLKINNKRLQLFNKTVFSKWINIKSVDHDNHLLNHVLQHQREVDFKSKEDSPKFDIGGHTLELGRIEFSLLTGFSVGKVIFPEVKVGDIPPLVRCLFPEKVPGKCKRQKGVSYNVKGRELLDFVKDDEKWKNISDVDVVRVYADAGRFSGEETVKEDKPSRKELELERLLRAVESRLQTVEMESTKLKEELAYLQKEKDAPHEKALSVPQVKQELSYAADDVHTMALDDDAKVCTDEPKPSTILHSFIPADGVQFMALDEDAKVCIYEEPKPSTTLHSDIEADDVQSIPFDDDAKCLSFFSTILNTPKDTGAEYMNEELRNGSHNKEPLSKQPYVPFSMHTRSRDYRPLDKQPEDKLVQDNAKVDSLLVSRVNYSIYLKFNVVISHEPRLLDMRSSPQRLAYAPVAPVLVTSRSVLKCASPAVMRRWGRKVCEDEGLCGANLERLGYVLPQDLSVGLILNGLTSDIARFVRNYNMHNIGKMIGELHALLIEHEKGLPKKDATPQVLAIQGGSIQKSYKKSRNAKGKGKGKGKRKDNTVYFLSLKKPNTPNAKGTRQRMNILPPLIKRWVNWKRNESLLPVECDKNSKVMKLVVWYSICNPRHRLRGEWKRKLSYTSIHTTTQWRVRKEESYLVGQGSINDESYNSAIILLGLCSRVYYTHSQYDSNQEGYPKETMGYYFYFPPENKIVVARYAEFLEKNLISQEVSRRAGEFKEIQDEDTSPSENTSKILAEVEGFEPPQEEEAHVE
ncbi:hypothetical protein Tco_0204766 [Tanacetum coccineum]